MTIDPSTFVGPGIVGALAVLGAYMAVRVAVAEFRVWSQLHQQRDDERHGENQRRLLAVEEKLEDNTRRDMREATRQMSAAVARLGLREGD